MNFASYLTPMLKGKHCETTFQQCYFDLFQQGCLSEKILGRFSPVGVKSPFSREVQNFFLQELIWDHAAEYPLPALDDLMKDYGANKDDEGMSGSGLNTIPITFDLAGEDKWMLDHVIDGSCLFPGCGYLYSAWKGFQTFLNRMEKRGESPSLTDVADVVISDFKIPKGIKLDAEEILGCEDDDDAARFLTLYVTFTHRDVETAGEKEETAFQIIANNELKAEGRIKLRGKGNPLYDYDKKESAEILSHSMTFNHPQGLGSIGKEVFYSRVGRNGYDYQDRFQLVENVGVCDRWAVVRFDQEAFQEENDSDRIPLHPSVGEKKGTYSKSRFWISFLDNLLQVRLFKDLKSESLFADSETLRVPVEIREVVIRGSHVKEFYKSEDAVVNKSELVVNKNDASSATVTTNAGSMQSLKGDVGSSASSMQSMNGDDSKAVVKQQSPLKLAEDAISDSRSHSKSDTRQQSPSILVKIHAQENKITCPLADITGLKLKAIPRSKALKDSTQVVCAAKKFYPLVRKCPSSLPYGEGLGAALELVRRELGGDLSVLDCVGGSGNGLKEGSAFMECVSNLVECKAVERFVVKFADVEGDDDANKAIRADYSACVSPDMYEEYAKDDKSVLNFFLVNGDATEVVEKHCSKDVEKAFVLITEGDGVPSTANNVLGLTHPLGSNSDLICTPILRFETNSDASIALMKLERKTVVDESAEQTEGPSDTDNRCDSKAIFVNMLNGQPGSHLTADAVLNVLRPELQRLTAGDDETSRKIFIVSDAPGFSGFLRCLQQEPSYAGVVRGVHVEGSSVKNSDVKSSSDLFCNSGPLDTVFGESSPIPGVSVDVLRRVEQLDCKLVRLARRDECSEWNIDVELCCGNYYTSCGHGGASPTKKNQAGGGVYAVFQNPGQLDSVEWKEQQPLMSSLKGDTASVDIHYSAVNFRDVMLAYGKLDSDCLVGYSQAGDGWGLEYSGLSNDYYGDSNPKPTKVIGLSTNCIGTSVKQVDKSLLFPLKSHMSLEDYATVPCVYATAYYSIYVRAGFKPETESILIHAGAGGVGQAALYITLSRCVNGNTSRIFTTCSDKKRKYLLDNFRHLGLKAENIFSSRDGLFEQKIKQRTEGLGVDVVLNSLDGDLLKATWRCVAPFGRFCEIGKYDLMSDSPLPMGVFLKNVSFLGIDLDQIMNKPTEWAVVRAMLQDGIESGEVRPLDRKVFDARSSENNDYPRKEAVTDAFRFLGAGHALGKVLIRFGGEEDLTKQEIANTDQTTVLPNWRPEANSTYIIVGGLGGFGLEFATFIAERAQHQKNNVNLVLCSRNRVRTALQAKCINEMMKTCRSVKVCTADLTVGSNVEKFVESIDQSTPIKGFFNCSAVLRDGLFSNLTIDDWEISMKAKVTISENFDKVLSSVNSLRHFVTWSSVSAGHGNAGQTNYGYANSSLDTLARKERGDSDLQYLSVQWGAIGDVGLLAGQTKAAQASGAVAANYQPMPISDCISHLEQLMNGTTSGVYEVYLAPKRVVEEEDAGGNGSKVSLGVKVAAIIGLKSVDKESAVWGGKTLESLGVDSLQGLEVQNAVKKYTGGKVKLSVEKLNRMTLKEVDELC